MQEDLFNLAINNPENWISYDEAAALVNMSKRALEKLVAERKITFIKNGRRVCFIPSILKAEILEQFGVEKSGQWDRL